MSRFPFILILRRIAAYVCSFAVGVHGVLFSEYNIPSNKEGIPEPHVFTGIQEMYRSGRLQAYLLGGIGWKDTSVKENSSETSSASSKKDNDDSIW